MVFRNVTTRRRAEHALAEEQARRQREDHQRASMADLDISIHEPHRLRALLDRVIELTQTLLPVHGACIVLADPIARLAPAPASELPGGFRGFDRNSRVTRWIIDNGQAITVPDITDDPFGPNPALADEGVLAYAGVPMIDEGTVCGVLFAVDDAVRHFSQDDLDFMTELAWRTAGCLTKVRLYTELARHREAAESLVEERTAALQETHRQLRAADRLASIGTLTAGAHSGHGTE